MKPSSRKRLLAVATVGVLALMLSAFSAMPRSGHPLGDYARLIDRVAVPERHATDIVSAVNFDYRGFDTLGEEFILFVSVVGVGVVLRGHGDVGDKEKQQDRDDGSADRPRIKTSDAVRLLGVGLVSITIGFGVYVCTHGQVSPGGGFQGGVVLATAPIVVYLSVDAKTFVKIAPEALVKAAEALGAAAFVVVGIAGLVAGAPFLTNVLPLGESGSVFSAGTIFVLNLAVGLAVAAGFVSLLLTFLAETLARRLEWAEEP